MYKLLALLGGVDSSVDDDADAGVDGESSALPSASIDPSVAAISGKQRFRDERNITDQTSPPASWYHSPIIRRVARKPSKISRGRLKSFVAVCS